ncbi:flagellar type III secretion system protein FlhB [Enterobacteriaceae bacterium YMB-R22]|uniref:flagellar biosynthesis protein FlhB n=1 Tax=Tenebrionicola larvae TaxID=2815733 RepID=UPI002012F870|nr:flagellar biosynthesis protein FlhB [Tenebrionicola larvae]MBV4414012.1 flagellar type III secretion system protein FlhB [Tenebrionicola larvae]
MSEESDQEKTEDPTPTRREKARKEGQIPRSKELTSLLMLVAGWALLWTTGRAMGHDLCLLLQDGLNFNHGLIHNPKLMLNQMGRLFLNAVSTLVPLMMGLVLVAIGSPVLLGGLHFSGKSFKPNFSRMNPLPGIKRMFSKQFISEMLKAVLKVTLVAATCGLYLWGNWANMLRLLQQPPLAAIGDALSLIAQCMLLIILSLIPMVGYDVFYQITSNLKKLRMTRQEIRDEFKQQEGDPHIKGRIRQQQRAAAQRRMMSDVPKADVIVNNPTHYSVALRYEEGAMAAPKVLAKGAGAIALRIRELGNEHRIPMLEAPPLARALYKHSEIGQPIPAALYSAVAEVLAWVYGLRRWRKEGGLIPRKPKNISVPAELDFARESKH